MTHRHHHHHHHYNTVIDIVDINVIDDFINTIIIIIIDFDSVVKNTSRPFLFTKLRLHFTSVCLFVGWLVA